MEGLKMKKERLMLFSGRDLRCHKMAAVSPILIEILEKYFTQESVRGDRHSGKWQGLRKS